MLVPEGWYPVAWSSAVRATPRRGEIAGVPLVLFRNGAGTVTALVDRCPHRGFPLSRGRVRDGALECGYHGWRFDGGGSCVRVPTLASGEAAGAAERAATAVPVSERDGLVRVRWPAGPGPAPPPPDVDTSAGPGALSLHWSFALDASLADALENVLDVPHTAFLHGGLFREPGRGVAIDVAVRRDARGIEARYAGEPAPRGLLGLLLAPRGGVVEHADRFVMPSIAQVEYGLGERMRLLATTFFAPAGPSRTLAWHVLSVAPRALALAALPLLAPGAWWVLRQDAVALRRLSANAARFPGVRRVSTEADVLGPHVEQMLDRAARGLAPLPAAGWNARIAP